MKPAHTHDLVSLYLPQPVLGGHRLHLQLSGISHGSHHGTLQVDPNICSLDSWGNAQICTKIAVRSFDVTTRILHVPDPDGLGRIQHQLTLAADPARALILIEYPQAALYVLLEGSSGPSGEHGALFVPLFPARLWASGLRSAAPTDGSGGQPAGEGPLKAASTDGGGRDGGAIKIGNG